MTMAKMFRKIFELVTQKLCKKKQPQNEIAISVTIIINKDQFEKTLTAIYYNFIQKEINKQEKTARK